MVWLRLASRASCRAGPSSLRTCDRRLHSYAALARQSGGTANLPDHRRFSPPASATTTKRLFSSDASDNKDEGTENADEKAADDAAENVDPSHEPDASAVTTPQEAEEALNAGKGDNFDINRFAFREPQQQRNQRGGYRGGRGGRGGGRGGRPGGGPGFDRPKRDPETGFEENGRLKLSLDGRMKENSGFVPLAMRDTIYRMHQEDPEGKGSLIRMAQQTGLRVMKIQGIIKLREEELRIEKEQGFPIDHKIDQMARAYFGEKKSWRGEFDETERKARIAVATSGRWRVLQQNEELPNMRKFGQATSLGGFFTPWRSPPKYQGEEVIKTDDRFVFLRAKKEPKKRKTLI